MLQAEKVSWPKSAKSEQKHFTNALQFQIPISML